MASRARGFLASPHLLIAIASISALLNASPCRAEWESDRVERDRPQNSIRAGATSVQFLTFGGGYRSPAFRTSGIYLKSHFSDRGALRIGTEFSYDNFSGESSPTSSPVSQDYESYSFSVSAEFDEYVDATGPVTAFLGAGPYWSRGRYTRQSSRTDIYNNLQYSSYSRRESKSWEVGASIGAGFEWFFKQKLSLVGRVGASLGFGKSHAHEEFIYQDPYGNRSGNDDFDTTTATASTSTAALGLGLYF